jgi:hypothetical protein
MNVDQMNRLFRTTLLVAMSSLLIACGSSKPKWTPNEALLAEIVIMDPETDASGAGDSVGEFFYRANVDPETGVKLSGSKRAKRNREAFEVVRQRLASAGAVVAGFNVCFPGSYVTPKDVSIDQLMTYGWECQLIQGNGQSVAALRKDPLVAKYLDANGNLVAGKDIDLMHEELNGAMYRIDPSNSQHSLYPDAQGNLEKVLYEWRRPRPPLPRRRGASR